MPEAKWGMSKIQGEAQFGSWNAVMIWTTDFSGSDPSGRGCLAAEAQPRWKEEPLPDWARRFPWRFGRPIEGDGVTAGEVLAPPERWQAFR